MPHPSCREFADSYFKGAPLPTERRAAIYQLRTVTSAQSGRARSESDSMRIPVLEALNPPKVDLMFGAQAMPKRVNVLITALLVLTPVAGGASYGERALRVSLIGELGIGCSQNCKRRVKVDSKGARLHLRLRGNAAQHRCVTRFISLRRGVVTVRMS